MKTWLMIGVALGALVTTACDSPGGGSSTPVVAPDATPGDVPPVDPPPTPGVVCGQASVGGVMACVDEARYLVDLVFVADVRPPGSAHWQAVQEHCAAVFESLGLEVERHDYGTGINVIGVQRGSAPAQAQVLVSAHYDHIEGCAGADDNATGVAGTLESARALATSSFQRTLVFACWDEEERGLIGSRAYAERALERGEAIETAFVYEMIGYRSDAPNSQSVPTGFELLFAEQYAEIEANQHRGDFVVLVGDDLAHDAMASIAELATVPTVTLEVAAALKLEPLLGVLRRSDHAPFWGLDYAAIMISDTSEYRNDHYHCDAGPDVVSDLDHGFATAVIRATVGAAARLAGPE